MNINKNQPAKETIESYRLHEILSLEDELYDPFLDLYQTAFPLNEQMLVSEHNAVLRGRAQGKSEGMHFFAALNAQDQFVGLARYDILRPSRVAVLWYLAVTPECRSKGVGSWLYQEIHNRIQSEEPAVSLLLLEVEDPEKARAPEERALATRRIAFYKRHNTRLLCGIEHIQTVTWQPPLPMLLMAYLYRPLEAEDVFQHAKGVFGEQLRQVAPLTLE